MRRLVLKFSCLNVDKIVWNGIEAESSRNSESDV